ncbi:MAG: ATP-dependent transcriptional regulator, partial [Aggregatilineales bacterium]
MILQKTKLLLPAPVSGVIQRPRLVDVLTPDYLLHAIVAPAGCGKTTLAVQWAIQQGQGVAWLSLDAEDNDAARFIRYIVAALQSVIKDVDIAQKINLNAAPSTVLINLSNVLIPHLEQPVCLILDNYQVIDTSVIHDILDFFLAHPVPNLNFVLLSRTDLPLSVARLRALQQVHEIHVQHL